MMTATRAKVPRPAAGAGLLSVDVALGQPAVLALAINACTQVAHRPLSFANKAVTCSQFTIRRYAEIACACTARVGPVRPTVEFAHRVDHIIESVALAACDAALKFRAAIYHCLQQSGQVTRLHLSTPGGRTQERRESHTVKSDPEKIVETLPQTKISGCDGRTDGDLHLPLSGKQRSNATYDLFKAAATVLERALEIVGLAQTIQTHRHRETVSFEKGGILFSQQRAVGGN